jgi:Fe2+ transport system protein FeoA
LQLTFIFNKPEDASVTLADLAIGVPARIVAVDDASSVVHRLMEMGLVNGAGVAIRKVAPFGDPLELQVRGYALSIRRAEARHFEVELA